MNELGQFLKDNIWKIMNAVSFYKLIKEEILAMCYDFVS